VRGSFVSDGYCDELFKGLSDGIIVGLIEGTQWEETNGDDVGYEIVVGTLTNLILMDLCSEIVKEDLMTFF